MEYGELSLVRGDNQTVGFTITDPGTLLPYNLSGASVAFNAWSPAEPATILIAKTETGFVNPTAGTGYIAFVPADTSSLYSNPYAFNMKLISINTGISTLIYGSLCIVPN